MESFKRIIRTPSAFVLLLVAIVSLIGIIIQSKTNITIARIPIDATSTAEARHTQLVNSSFTSPASTTTSSAPKFIEKIIMSADLPLGITFEAPDTGTYAFEYVDSAYIVDDGCWVTNVYAYPISILPMPANEKDILFSLGTRECLTSKEKAIEQTRGQIAYFNLNTGDTIRFITGDSYYSDNVGAIIIEIYLY